MKKINFKKIVSGRRIFLVLIIFTTVFLFGRIAWAGFGEWAGNLIGGIIAVFIQAISLILILLVNVLIDVASYSDFINATAVTKGWVIVRDICNMFFVLILLVIAFATILGQEEYSAKKTLPKLIIAAVLINFSKMFCGLMIDVANVMMLTFVNAFKEIGSGNIIDMLGVTDVVKMGSGTEDITFSQIVGAYIFGLIYIIIATVVVASMLGMLVMRIVMIWIYVVLSPAAFFLQAIPGKGQSYAAQWWSKWTSNLIVGPVIAFFLWLSFAALQTGGSPIVNSSANGDAEVAAQKGLVVDEGSGIPSEAGKPSSMAKFAIAIGMLLGGMKIAQEVGGETGSMLGKGMAQLNKGKALAIGAGIGAAKGIGRGAGRLGLGAVSRGDRLLSGSKGDNRATWAGKMAKGWGDDLQASAKKRRKETAGRYLKNLGMGEKSAEQGQNVIAGKNFQNIHNAMKGAAVGSLTGMAVAGPLGALAGLATGFAGYVASSKRQATKTNVKNYEESKNDNTAQVAYNKAKLEYDGHQNIVTDYDTREARVIELDNLRRTRPLSTDEQSEYDEKDVFINTTANIDKLNASKSYLTNNQQDLQTKKDAFDAKEQVNLAGKDQYDKDKKSLKNTEFLERFADTDAAMKDLTKSKAAATAQIKNQADNSDFWHDKNARLYAGTGLSKDSKNQLDILNKGGSKDADGALKNLVNAVPMMSNEVAENIAKALAAYSKDNPLDKLTTVKTALQNKTNDGSLKRNSGLPYDFNPDNHTAKVSVASYKDFDKNQMILNSGSGGLSYDAFAKNSAKDPSKRNNRKDIMGASFAKINSKAKEMGEDYSLEEGAGVTQENDGEKLKSLSRVMTKLIDDEIVSLQTVSGNVNSEKISQLNESKKRLASGDLSGIKLKNSDITYKGDNDSEKRSAEYNSTQHEIMHGAGAKNEELVYDSADALQSNKLIGRIPGTNQNYDTEIGKLIASMEKSQATQAATMQAVTSKIDGWKVSNAQRVVETENGQRDSVSDTTSIVNNTTESGDKAIEIGGLDKFEESLDKFVSSIDKQKFAKGTNTAGTKSVEFDPSIKFRNFMSSIAKKQNKADDKNTTILKTPLAKMAAAAAKK